MINKIKVLVQPVKRFGNGCHVIVPRNWFGKIVKVTLTKERRVKKK